MSSKKTLLSVAVGTAFVASVGVAIAADNPFALQSLDKGYMVADHHEAKPKTMKEGKCGEGKCGNMKMGEGQCGMMMADTNKDGKISKEEAMKHHEEMFAMMDANKDGFIDKDEMAKGMKAKEGKCGNMKK